MKQIRKILSAALLTAVMVTAAAPSMESYAAAKEFTYADQKSGEKVTQLEMSPEEKVDLCFKGVPDYYKYKCVWTSSNEDVATVDGYGVITAKSQGTAEVVLTLGDGSVYTSEPVTVTVVSMNLTAGNSGNKAMDVVELKKGATLDLNFYGVTDWSARKGVYLTEWLTSNTAVATVEQSTGVVTAEAEGTAVVVFQIYDMEKNILLSSAPVTIIVTE
ncbi:MAG: Ig-like domain-containing protein [Lachnospiraceae bacterium]|nr:Ig-like domain-containing protein [Lachnospiraceae bacterium]